MDEEEGPENQGLSGGPGRMSRARAGEEEKGRESELGSTQRASHRGPGRQEKAEGNRQAGRQADPTRPGLELSASCCDRAG